MGLLSTLLKYTKLKYTDGSNFKGNIALLTDFYEMCITHHYIKNKNLILLLTNKFFKHNIIRFLSNEVR